MGPLSSSLQFSKRYDKVVISGMAIISITKSWLLLIVLCLVSLALAAYVLDSILNFTGCHSPQTTPFCLPLYHVAESIEIFVAVLIDNFFHYSNVVRGFMALFWNVFLPGEMPQSIKLWLCNQIYRALSLLDCCTCWEEQMG
jgi:hypothetical protein